MSRDITVVSDDNFDDSDGSFHRDEMVAQYEVGQWYWVSVKKSSTAEPKDELMCCVHIGSNYIELDQPDSKRPMMAEGSNGYKYDFEVSSISFRMHFNDAEKYNIRHEPNSAFEIRKIQDSYAKLANKALADIKEVSQRLGLRMDGLIANNAADASTGTSVSILNGVPDVKGYENALVVAKKETLPHLFNNLKMAHAGVQQWMSAESMVMNTVISSMNESVKQIDDRLFNVSLYAGLEEFTKQCCEGKPADISEKLHVMQRKLYMDEECLMNYTGGGMDIDNIGQFDEWISKPENRDRILPFPRTIVAMQVRRHTKDRPWLNAFVNIDYSISDKYTYLYIRNGDQVWRISFNKFEFTDSNIFPDKSVFDPSEPMMFKWDWRKVERFMTLSEFESIKEKYDAEKAVFNEKFNAWKLENPGLNKFDAPYEIRKLEPNDRMMDFDKWHRFDESSVYYDDAVKMRADEMSRYNRVALIIQGIFDRSPILAPHFPVKTWMPDSFNRAIELVYDANTLYEGDEPDFYAYMKELNAKATQDSVFTGQQYSWMRANAEKQNNKESNYNRYGERTSREYLMYVPDHDNGMTNICKANNITKAGVTFKWMREKAWTPNQWSTGVNMIQSSYRAPWNEVFNVSAYTPGDFKKFFRDPRTRSKYMDWAPYLLAAEDYWARVNNGQDPSDKTGYRSVFKG